MTQYVVYSTKDAEKYHSIEDGCSCLEPREYTRFDKEGVFTKADEITRATVREAESDGYEPCKRCMGES